jgi:hypothetical protein
MAADRSKSKPGGPFRFRVSDVAQVPLRGYLLRLRLLEGNPAIGDAKPGGWLRLEGPGAVARTVRIVDHSVTGGRQKQQRLSSLGELDVVISVDDARGPEGEPVEIGWTASGPARADDERAA